MLSSQGFGLQCHASLEVEVFRFVKTSKSSDPRIVNRSVLKTPEVGSKSVNVYYNFLIQHLLARSLGTARYNAKDYFFQKVARSVRVHGLPSPATAYPKLFDSGKNSKRISFLGSSKSTIMASNCMMFTCCP